MRIGIISMVDISTFLPFFEEKEDKILLESNCYPNAAPAVNTLILSFLKAGHFVRIFTIANNSFKIQSQNLEIHTVTAYQKYPWKYLWGVYKNAYSLKVLLKDRLDDLDVLHAHWTYDFAYAASYYSKQIPVICTVRDWASYIWKIESAKNKITWCFKYIINGMVFQQEDIHFVANSPYTAQLIEKKYHKTVPIIPNSIKSSFIRTDSHLQSNKLNILCISSSNDKRKNIKNLLKAFGLFRQKFPNAILQLVGAPFIEGEPIIEKWKRQNLLQQVILVGSVKHDKLIEYIDQATLFITPSLEETFGNTLLESIVRKVPVIGGINSGAVPYVLQYGEAGFLCDVSNPNSICSTLEYVCTNPQEVNKVVQRAYQIITTKYNDSTICDQYISLYTKSIK